MSPTDEIIQEVDSLEEATNEAIQALAETVNLTSSLVEEHASKIEELDERVGKYEDLGQTVDDLRSNFDDHDCTLGNILQRLQMLERISALKPEPELKRLHQLEAQARTLGTNWAEVEVYERHDGMLVINHFLGQRSMIEDRIAQSEAALKTAAPKTSPTC